MPGPDPHTLWIDVADPRRPCVTFQPYFWTGNSGNRKARALAILRRLRWGDWICGWCDGPLPDYVRADARYRREACRRAAARQRRAAR